ncbi:50S ribosomal protein L15 [Pontibacter silvestris]|uniref:Large ribosomal subunit protein uL15 n=1 Tax=Pontibacter silvestris TaxID=2305183 RepID=A0ABW4WWD2_9BACT|nr:50S ribosomal protein L15 [Pontibacter silvestris]MCC9137663.1 50S ribosomal protein L15 [Pontibacter silvestris]
MYLNSLKPAEGSVKNRKRLGRGTGSGRGGTSTRGHKGAKSRSGYSQKGGFEGGQMPLQRRVPKYGFKNFNRVEFKAINLDVVQSLAEATNETVLNFDFFKAHGLVSKNDKVKILGRGEINKAVEVHAHAFSKTAISSIETAGGKTVAI